MQADAHFILDYILWYGIVMRGILGIFFGNFAFFEGVLPALRRRGEGSPLDIFPFAFLVVGTFILTQKEVTLLANVRDSERLQKGNLPIDKSGLSGLSVRIKQCSVWRWETGGERSRRKRRRRKWEVEQRDGHFISTAKDLQAGYCDPKVHVRTVGSQERRARTLSSLSQSPLTLFDSSFWKYF